MVWNKGDCPRCGKPLSERKKDWDLRIKRRCRDCEFDIHPAMMDAGLGNYGEIILGLLEEGYGFKSGDWEKGKKWVVKKERPGTLTPYGLHAMLEEALKIIFKLLHCYRKEITK